MRKPCSRALEGMHPIMATVGATALSIGGIAIGSGPKLVTSRRPITPTDEPGASGLLLIAVLIAVVRREVVDPRAIARCCPTHCCWDRSSITP